MEVKNRGVDSVKLSRRIENVSASATLAASQKANDLKAKGIDVISLTVGESDFPTPEYISDAAIQSIKEHRVDQYTAVNGVVKLRETIANTYATENEQPYQANQVFVGSGVKNVLFTLFQVIVDPEDEVILPVPYWVSFSEQIKMAGGKPVFVKGKQKDQFKVTVKDLDAVLTDKTVAIVINSPSNPSGAVYSKEELQAIGEWAVANDVLIVADEIYKRLVYNGQKPVSFSTFSDEIREQTIILDGVSKTYAMTGWRIGYAIGNSKITSAMSKYASHANGNPAAVSQQAAITAYQEETNEVVEMVQSFEHRLNKAYDLMKTIPGFKLYAKPAGAFYLFPDVSEAAEMTGYDSVEDFCLALIEEAHVVSVPGSSFGVDECLRFSYAVDEEVFAEGMKRIKRFIENNSK